MRIKKMVDGTMSLYPHQQHHELVWTIVLRIQHDEWKELGLVLLQVLQILLTPRSISQADVVEEEKKEKRKSPTRSNTYIHVHICTQSTPKRG